MRYERLTFRSLDIRVVRAPLKRPIAAKIGSFNDWPLILIDLQTEEGIVGRSYLGPYSAAPARYIVPALHDLAAARAGKPLNPFDDFRDNQRLLNLVGYEGISLIAVSGIDMAMWDALAKSMNVPLAVLLGGSIAPVSAYNSGGLWLNTENLQEEAAALAAEGGFRGLKLRLGRERVADDLAAIKAVRAGVGDDVKLMVDFNQGLSLGDALHRCRALDDEDLYWLEEPIVYNNYDGYRQLAHDLKTPVQLGENFYGPRSLHQALSARACDYVMPDLMRIGGVTGWLRAAAIAGAAGVEMSSHLYPEFSAHLLCVTETAHWLEWQDWAHPVLSEPFQLSNGSLEVPDRPGAGIEWDEAAVKRYRHDA
jgi:mandelate racemase